MRIIVQEINDKENVDSDKIFNLEIEQLDITSNKFYKIADEIKSRNQNKAYALSVIHFGAAYLRIYNFIEYLNNKFLSKSVVLDLLLKIKNEVEYINNTVYDDYKKCFLSYVDKKSNLHQIKNLGRCIDNLIKIVEKYEVDK